MLNELKKKFAGVYTKEHLKELEEIEKLLQFEYFTSIDAYLLGSLIVDEARKINGDLIIFIKREENQFLMYHYAGEKMTQRNIDFATKKRNAVLKSGHCSLWPLVKEVVDGGQTEIFSEDSNCVPVGGAFPIYVDGKMVATIALSGLHEGMDFTLVIRALAAYHHVPVPIFHGKCI